MNHTQLYGPWVLVACLLALAVWRTWGTIPARILHSLPLWLLYSSVALVLDIVGLVIMVPLAACHAWRVRGSWVYAANGVALSRSLHPGPRPVTAWRGWLLTWLWSNEEDGVTGPVWWQQRTGVHGAYPMVGMYWAKAWSAYRWSALRNPSNNMRFVPGINPVIRPDKVRSVVRFYDVDSLVNFWAFTWQGPFSSIRAHLVIRGATYRFWWGWKLKPEDAQGLPPDDMRAPRCGFATQFKRIG